MSRIPAAADAPGDLDRQQRLTDVLLTARPDAAQSPGRDPHTWTEALTEALSAPVLMESYGPTTADKVYGGGGSRAAAELIPPGSRNRCPETSPAGR